jgi:hypothetical protein
MALYPSAVTSVRRLSLEVGVHVLLYESEAIISILIMLALIIIFTKVQK